MLNYPLHLNFKKLALAHQISVTDSSDNLIWYVKQKAFKLKEDVSVYADEAQTRLVFKIAADRVIDWNARYDISGASGEKLGAIKRQGMKSLWKSQYDVTDARGASVFSVREANPWAKVFDSMLSEVPVLGALTGYVFHPAYIVSRPSGTPMFRVTKRPAMLEGKYRITVEGKYAENEEPLAMASMLMMLLLERMRG